MNNQPFVARIDGALFARSWFGALFGAWVGRSRGIGLGVVWGIGGALMSHWFVMGGEARTYLLEKVGNCNKITAV